MSVLSDGEIKALVELGKIGMEGLIIKPYIEKNIGPASIDLTLSNKFLVVKNSVEVIRMDTPVEYDEIKADEFTIPPQSFVLASTVEYVGLPPNVSGSISGRSSIGRLGLFVENAGWIDPNFHGNITLELYNANRKHPVIVTAGRRICQIILDSMNVSSEHPYSGKYADSHGTIGSLIYKD